MNSGFVISSGEKSFLLKGVTLFGFLVVSFSSFLIFYKRLKQEKETYMEKTLTRKEPINSIARNLKLSQPKATAFLEFTLETIKSALAEGGKSQNRLFWLL